MSALKPGIKLLRPATIRRIVEQALDLLEKVGVAIDNPEAVAILSANGARVETTTGRTHIPAALVERCLSTVPRSFSLYNRAGRTALGLKGRRFYFAAGSTALNLLDLSRGCVRKPTTLDYIKFTRLADGLPYIDAGSTAMIPDDVPGETADAYRLYLSLIHSTKPIVTGAFSAEGFGPMKEMLAIVRGSETALREKPLAIFDVCPSSPLKWHHATSQNLIDCARGGIPAELVSMPLAGALGPATLAGSVVQHTAETLSGLVIHQLAGPGAPLIYGGSPAVFDMKCGTSPMGAVETMMIDVAYTQVGQHLGLPTHAYMGLSDSKVLDMQAGLESAMGIVLAALAGVNIIAGPGMLDFESCQSMEKLVIDNEICGMAHRLLRGIDDSPDALAQEVLLQLPGWETLLDHEHTLAHYRKEHFLVSPVIERAKSSITDLAQMTSAEKRATALAERALAKHEVPPLPQHKRVALDELMLLLLRQHGMDKLPATV